MMLLRSAIALMFVALAFAETPAQQRPILSPRDSVFLTLDTNTVSVNYGRPAMRGRKIMGELVPWNKIWRTGANQATHFRTSFDMTLGGVPVPRGTYTFWTLPSPTGWKFILNKQTGQWGTVYDERQDLARFDAAVSTTDAPVDTFTIRLLQTGKTSGLLRLAWERTVLTVPFEKNDRIRPISPLDSTETVLKGKKVSISYSRPYARGRAVWGVVVPFDSVWRTGANRTTTLTAERDILLGRARIPAGSYTLYSLPTAKGFTLIVSRKPAGFPAYDPSMDVARVQMVAVKKGPAVDPFRIWFEETRKGTNLRIGWMERSYTLPITAR